MAKSSSLTPMHQGGRTLAKMGKKGKDGGGKRMNRRTVWWENGTGYTFGPPTSKHDRRGRIYPEGETPAKVMKPKA
jgi:hypothetical protein